MKHLRRIRPLGWFVLIWVIVIPAGGSVNLAFWGLEFVHLSLYALIFSQEIKGRSRWYYLSGQTVLVFFLSFQSRDMLLAFAFSLSLLATTVDTLKKGWPILCALGSYLSLALLYIFWIAGPQDFWNTYGIQHAPIAYILILVFFLGGLCLVLYVQQRQAYKETRKLLYELDTAHNQLSAYALRVEELTTLTERQRLARELHDTLSQGLVGLVMQLDAANAYFEQGQSSEGHTTIVKAMTRARSMLTDTRYVIADLRDRAPRPEDLPELVQEKSERFTSATGIPCETEIEGLVSVPAEYTEQVLRVITEGLTNVARHAHAQQVWILANNQEQMLEIEIRDDGVGFDAAIATGKAGHYGLVGLRERARLIGGKLEISSSHGQGSCIRLQLARTLQGIGHE